MYISNFRGATHRFWVYISMNSLLWTWNVIVPPTKRIEFPSRKKMGWKFGLAYLDDSARHMCISNNLSKKNNEFQLIQLGITSRKSLRYPSITFSKIPRCKTKHPPPFVPLVRFQKKALHNRRMSEGHAALQNTWQRLKRWLEQRAGQYQTKRMAAMQQSDGMMIQWFELISKLPPLRPKTRSQGSKHVRILSPRK